MKRFFCFKTAFFSLVLVFFASLNSCAKKNQPVSQNQQSQLNQNPQSQESTIKITASFYPLYIMLMNITDGAQNVELSLLAPANTGCLHDYQLTTKDMKAIEDCTIFVVNGAGMEDFLDKVLELKKDSLIVASEGYTLVDENAHIWVSPKGAIFEVQNICNALCELDSKNSELYKKNTEIYCEKLNLLSEKMHSELDEFAGTKIITFHEAFPYFASEFNLDLIAVMENEEGEEPSTKDLYELVKLINNCVSNGEKLALFGEETFPSSAAEILSKETGLSVGTLDPCVTGDLQEDSYILAMEKNLEVLKEFLK